MKRLACAKSKHGSPCPAWRAASRVAGRASSARRSGRESGHHRAGFQLQRRVRPGHVEVIHPVAVKIGVTDHPRRRIDCQLEILQPLPAVAGRPDPRLVETVAHRRWHNGRPCDGGLPTSCPLLFDFPHIHRHLDGVRAAAHQDAADGADIAEIAPVGDGDVFLRRAAGCWSGQNPPSPRRDKRRKTTRGRRPRRSSAAWPSAGTVRR